MIPPQAFMVMLLIALVAGFAGGWQTRTWKAEAEAALALRDERDARQRAEASLAQRSSDIETQRTEADKRLYEAQRTIREMYRARTRPSPGTPPTAPESGSESLPDCAPPDGARELLIGLGASAPAAPLESGEPVPGAAGAAAAVR